MTRRIPNPEKRVPSKPSWGRLCLPTLVLTACLLSPARAADPDAATVAVLRSAMDAMGGEPLLSALKSLSLDLRETQYRVDDSERAEAPFWTSYQQIAETRDLAAYRYRSETTTDNPQFQFHTVTVSDGKVVASGVTFNGRLSWRAKPDTHERLELAPENVLFAAAGSDDLHSLPDVSLHGVVHHDLRFTWRGFPVDLFVNADTHLPDRVVSLRTNPYDVAQHAWGDIRWSTDYLFWKRQPDGLVYPLQWDTSRNGEPMVTDSVIGLKENPGLDGVSFDIPAETQQQFEGGGKLPLDDQPFDGDKQLSPLGKGVWQITGNWNVLVVEQADGLVVVECPQATGYSVKVLDFLARRFPGRKVKALVSTTDSTWHYAGLRTYAARDLPVYALDRNLPLLRSFLAAPHTLAPDDYARAPRKPRLHAVSGRTVIGEGDARMELYPMRGEADERMMLVYFPALRLLYGSSNDVSVRPEGKVGTFNLPEAVEAAHRLRLDVETYVGIHTTAMPWPEVEKIASGPVGH